MNALNLILHCGAKHVGYDDILMAPTPDGTDTWQPIPHSDLVEGVRSTFERNGLSVVNEAHGMFPDGSRYFGLMQVANGESHGDYGLVVGLRNSHDKTLPAGLACGAGVFVCDNLSFSGEVRLARKHTAHIRRDLPNLIDRAVGRLLDVRGHQDKRIEAYKGTELADMQAHDLLVRAVDNQALPVKRFKTALKEWRYPRHPEFAEGRTAWRLFNGVTEALKGTDLNALPRRTEALHGLLDVACGVN